MESNVTVNVTGCIFLLLMLIAGIAWQVWQFNLCYPEVSDSFWYCIQHAMSGS